MGGPGVQRGVKFAKYLPAYGVAPYVVTRTVTAREDESLLADAAGIPVRYARHIPFQRLGNSGGPAAAAPAAMQKVSAFKRVRDWLQLPDHVLSWVPFAVATGKQWADQIQPSAIFSTSPYHSTHLAALRLKRALNIPWIAEFRDPWAGDLFTNYPTEFHRKANAALERKVVEAADAVVVVSDGMRKDFRSRYPRLPRVEVIYNGFDAADFQGVDATLPPGPYTIRHLGTFYPDRKPDAFLRGLALFLKRTPQARPSLKVELYGRHHSDVEARLRALCDELGLREVVAFHPYVSHHEAIKLLRTSHALLLVPGPGETTVTGKLFEYLAAARPILATAPYPSGIDEIFNRLGGSPLRVDDTPEAVVPALEKLFLTLEAGEPSSLVPPPARTEEFTREGAAQRLAKLVGELRPPPVRL
jgi:glycosyltransferase involved in cell wall biosynthesis